MSTTAMKFAKECREEVKYYLGRAKEAKKMALSFLAAP